MINYYELLLIITEWKADMPAIYKNFLPIRFRGEAERNFEKYVKTQDKICRYFGLSNKIYLNILTL